jgi:hypothetical protein
MSIRLLCVSTAANTDAVLHALVGQSKGQIELALHLGGTQSDFKASAVSRMNLRRGRKGHITEGHAQWRGLAHGLFLHEDYNAWVDDFMDHLQRRAEPHAHLPHPLRSFHDHWDYFHLLADVLAGRIVDSGATHALFFNVPHLVHDTLVWQISRALGLQTLIVTQAPFPNRFFSMRTIEDYGRLGDDRPEVTPWPIAREENPQHFYMKGIGQEPSKRGGLTGRGLAQLAVFLALKRPLSAFNPLYVTSLVRRMHAVGRALPSWRDPFARFFHEDSLAYFEHLAGFENQTPDLSKPFVYVPLHLQPEMTTSALGGPFKDQALAIEALARMLPPEVAILVKENPKQGAYMRGPLFFHRLRRIPNLTFVPSHTSTHELTARSLFVATISGTVGWEAIRKGKPALVFGPTWYADLPGVVRWRDDLTLDAILAAAPDHPQLEQRVGQLLSGTHEGVIERHYRTLVSGFEESINTQRVADSLQGLLVGGFPHTFAANACEGSAPKAAAI